MNRNSGYGHLSLQTARDLVKRELGISSAPLRQVEMYSPDAILYEMRTGRFSVRVMNGWQEKRRNFILEISSGSGPSFRLFYNTATMEEDANALYSYEQKIEKERCAKCWLMKAAREEVMRTAREERA